MLHLTKGNTAQKIVLTLTEKLTLTTDYEYLFNFVHATTKQVVTFVRTPAEDRSTYPERFNEFDVDTAATFLGYPTGEYLYTVWERDTVTNVVGAVLEVGKLQLAKETEFSYPQYNPPTTYAAYSG